MGGSRAARAGRPGLSAGLFVFGRTDFCARGSFCGLWHLDVWTIACATFRGSGWDLLSCGQRHDRYNLSAGVSGTRVCQATL